MKTQQKHHRPWLRLSLLGLLTALLLSACGGAPAEPKTAVDTYATAGAATEEWEMDIAPEAPMADDAGAAEAYSEAGVGMAASPVLTLPKDDRKIILTANLSMESLEFENSCKKLEQLTDSVGGYVSATEISSGTAGTRSAWFTLRIPAGSYSRFIGDVGSAGNLLHRSESTEEVTQQVTDIEARLKSLRAQEIRLLELMQSAETVIDLFAIQEKLTDVQYEIEYYTASQRHLNDQVAYSTVHITVSEVLAFTEPPQEGFGAQLAAAFRAAWQDVGAFFQGLVWVLARIFPLLLLAVVLLAVVLILVYRHKKRRPPQPPANTPPPPQNPAV